MLSTPLPFIKKIYLQNVPLRRHLYTSTCYAAINKYRTSTREYILNNEKLQKAVDLKKSLIGIQNPQKKDIIFVNRNPRHMDLMGYNKPVGFSTLYDSRNFYNKLNLEITTRHTNAFVENINSEILCYASTMEPYINAQLHNTTDVMAIVNIARILAERCKQAGITRVHWVTRLDRRTEKMREFEGILINNGIILSEQAARVLQGPSATLPPGRKKRVLPRQLPRCVKRQGTKYKKDKKDFINKVCLDG